MIKDILRLGDKVDIRPQYGDKTGPTYRSRVNEITKNGNVEVMMPIEGSRIILLPLGGRYLFEFYAKGGLYRAVGQVKERYKKDNIYVLLIELRSQLKKRQRREYYRYSCLHDVTFFNIEEDEAKEQPPELIFANLRERPGFYAGQIPATLLDLSGGGARMIAETEIEPDSYILLVLRLSNNIIDKQYYLKGHVLATKKLDHQKGRSELRVKFIFFDAQVQEEIIRYIFEEERRSRSRR